MLKYIIKRILWIIPILIGVTIVVFTILYFSPGDPAYLALGDNATPEAVEAYRIEMGINGTYWERLGRTLLGLFQGDLGISYRSRTPVLNELLVRFSVTFNISAWSIVLGIILGIFFGIVAALKQNTILDSLCTGCALFGISMPMFWQGLMLILIFSVGLGWLPASGYGNITVMYLGQMVEKAGSAEIFAHGGLRHGTCRRQGAACSPQTAHRPAAAAGLLPLSAALAGPICTAVTHRRTSPLLP